MVWRWGCQSGRTGPRSIFTVMPSFSDSSAAMRAATSSKISCVGATVSKSVFARAQTLTEEALARHHDLIESRAERENESELETQLADEADWETGPLETQWLEPPTLEQHAAAGQPSTVNPNRSRLTVLVNGLGLRSVLRLTLDPATFHAASLPTRGQGNAATT